MPNPQRIHRVLRKRIVGPLLQRFRPEVEVALKNGKMCINLRDCVIAQHLYSGQAYEPEIQQFIRLLELDGAVCVDVGANIGLHTILMSQCVGVQGKVYAFEPEAYNFKLLNRNLQLNGCLNVIPIQTALGETSGSTQIYKSQDNFGDHYVASAPPPGRADTAQIQETPITTLDAALAKLPEGVVKFIKIDVQGYERYVLNGMRQTVQKHPNVILQMEIEPELLTMAGSSATAVIEALRDYGFDGWEIHSARAIPLQQAKHYEFIRGRGYVNVVLSRDSEALDALIVKIYAS